MYQLIDLVPDQFSKVWLKYYIPLSLSNPFFCISGKICQMLHLQLKQTPHNEKVKINSKNNIAVSLHSTSLNSDLTHGLDRWTQRVPNVSLSWVVSIQKRDSLLLPDLTWTLLFLEFRQAAPLSLPELEWPSRFWPTARLPPRTARPSRCQECFWIYPDWEWRKRRLSAVKMNSDTLEVKAYRNIMTVRRSIQIVPNQFSKVWLKSYISLSLSNPFLHIWVKLLIFVLEGIQNTSKDYDLYANNGLIKTVERLCWPINVSCTADEMDRSLSATGKWLTVSSFLQCTFCAVLQDVLIDFKYCTT